MAEAAWVQGYLWGVPWVLDFRMLYQRGGGTESPYGVGPYAFDRFVDSLTPDAPWLVPAEPEPSLVHLMAMWLWSHGVEIPPRDAASIEGEDAIGRLYEVGRRGGLAQDGAWLSAPRANTTFFEGGRGAWLVSRPRFVEDPDAFRLRGFPECGAGPNVFVGGSYLCVTARGMLHPEAFTAVRLLASVAAQSRLTRASALWPATGEGATPSVEPPIDAAVMAGVAQQGRSLPALTHWQYLEELIAHGSARLLRQILQGGSWTDVRSELNELDRNLGLLRAVTML
jgi:hypothetical protein